MRPSGWLQVLLGRTLYASGNQDAGLQLYTAVIQRDESNTAALVEYARAYVERARPGEALRLLLKALVTASTDRAARELIGAVVRGPGGLQALCQELGDAVKSGPALAFVATMVKDQGAVEQSVALYYMAVEAAPTMTTYWLNLVHTLEVCNRYQEAFDLCLRFCREHPGLTVGGRYTNAEVAALFDGVTDIYASEYRPGAGAHPGLARTPVWIPNFGAVVRDRADPHLLAGTDPAPGDAAGVAGSACALPSPAAAPPPAQLQRLPPYSADELDLLALHFTMAKILYVAGGLALIPALTDVVERARRGSGPAQSARGPRLFAGPPCAACNVVARA